MEKALVLRQPLWKWFGLVAGSIAFVLGGIVIIEAGNIVLGVICVAFFGACGVIFLLIPRTVLSADKTGITIMPTFRWQHNPTSIPWSEIRNIAIATQRVIIRGQTHTPHMLAIYLKDSDFLTKKSRFQQVGAAMTQMAAGTMDDGGDAQIYISATRLPGFSLEHIVSELNALRPTIIAESTFSPQKNALT